MKPETNTHADNRGPISFPLGSLTGDHHKELLGHFERYGSATCKQANALADMVGFWQDRFAEQANQRAAVEAEREAARVPDEYVEMQRMHLNDALGVLRNIASIDTSGWSETAAAQFRVCAQNHAKHFLSRFADGKEGG